MLTTPPTPEGQLTANQCVEVASATLTLAASQNADAARAAADTLEKYGPPQNVSNAIEHLAVTRNAMFTDLNFGANSVSSPRRSKSDS